MCDSDWKKKLSMNMEIFDDNEREEFYNILLNNYNEFSEKKNTSSAHKLKGNCLQLGITPIATIAENIEKNGGYDIHCDNLKNLMNDIKNENLFKLTKILTL